MAHRSLLLSALGLGLHGHSLTLLVSYDQIYQEDITQAALKPPRRHLDGEKVANDRRPSRNIHLNMAVNTRKKLRGLVPSTVPGLRKTSGQRVVSHEVVLRDKLATKTSFSLNCLSNLDVEDLKKATLYHHLKKCLLTKDQLKENGYPFLRSQAARGHCHLHC
ncbi:RNA exonuclease 1 like protein [Myotis brandtii]|uniref:RNA exonuclease 1 like protein n=1 Tax=Myotis brandtii TaxID=109478 RepID=S7PN33_MYOBR|nr:RNA exonuclease 1 like protein [Myotis brandtii]